MLGEAKVRSLKYIKKNVEAALLKLNDSINDNSKIARLLSNWVSIGVFHSRADLKKTLQRVYDSLDIKEKAKATQIERYFDCEPMKKRINGNLVDGYYIICPKFVFGGTQ